jgi:hypothetical protein
VRKWFGPAPSDNKRAVLKHWLELIGRVTELTLRDSDFDRFLDVSDRMIRRAASACSVSSARKAVVYQVFDVGKTLAETSYVDSLKLLANAIEAAGKLDILLHYVPSDATRYYAATQLVIDTVKKEEIPGIARGATLKGGLFRFGYGIWTVVSTSAPVDVAR